MKIVRFNANMKKLVLFLFFTVLTSAINAQVGMGEWRMFPSPNIVKDVVAGNGNVYGLLETGILEYDETAHEQTLWTAANFLSAVRTTAIAYDASNNILVVGYQNGNIDLIQKNSVYNIPAIYNAQINGNKEINDIEIEGNEAYISTGVGIVVLDINKREIKDTYNPSSDNEEYIDVTFSQDSIYVLTKTQLFVGSKANQFLADPSQWTINTLVPQYDSVGYYQNVVSFSGNLFLSFRNTTVGNSDTIFKISNLTRSVFMDDFTCRDIQKDGNKLIVSRWGAISVYDNALTPETTIFQYKNGGSIIPNGACFENGIYYIADNNNGLVQAKNSWNSEKISFPGPRYNSAYRVKWTDGRLSIACGGMDGKVPTFSKDGGSTEKEGKWLSTSVYTSPTLNGSDTWDFLSTAIDPTNSDIVAYGTNSAVPLIITNKGTVVDTFGFSNSLLEKNSSGWARISDMCYDDDGNLWMLNSGGNNPLKVLTKDGQWYQFDLGNSAKNKYTGRIIIDQNNVKWLCLEGLGIIAFDNGDNIADKSDDKYKVFTTAVNYGNLPSNVVQAIAADIDNNIWIGTPEGMRILYNTDDIMDASPGDYDFQKLLIQYGANVEIVLGYTNITALQVDGGNRKWIGTSTAGVFLLSPDGMEVDKKFTTDNSPLLDNSILDIGLDRSTGITYFVTSKGLIAYRSDASQGDQEYTNVKVFPNPVRPDYYGPITIQGIAYNSDVRITDVSGRLVYHTTSNGGTATWNGQTLTGERAATGVYLIWTSINDHDVKGRKVGKVVFIH